MNHSEKWTKETISYAIPVSLRLGGSLSIALFSSYCAAVLSLIGLNSLYAGAAAICGLLISGAMLATQLRPLAASRATFTRMALDLFLLSLVLYGCSTVASSCLDLSYDGQMHQQEAIIQLADSWNPYRGDSLDRSDLGVGMERVTLFLNHYPKFPWLLGAVIYRASGILEAAKSLNMLLFCSSLLLCYGCFRAVFSVSSLKAGCYSFLLAGNPIVLTQLFNSYVDGPLASLLLLLLFFGICYLYYRNTLFALGLAGSAIALINVKLTGLPYTVILLVPISASLFLLRHPARKGFFISSFAGIVLGTAVFGWQPYMTNLLQHGTLFYPVVDYPLSGVTPADESLIQQQLPADFVQADRFTKLFRSLASRSANISRPEASQLKYPWQVDWQEVTVFHLPDVRVGGFGPLFGVAYCLSAVLLLLLVSKSKLPTVRGVLLFVLLLFCSALVNPEAWWARYVPQLAWIPVIIGIFAWEKSTNTLQRLLAICLLAALSVNFLLVGGSYVTQQAHANDAAQLEYQRLAQENTPIYVQLGHFRAIRKRLESFGITFYETTELTCLTPGQLPALPVRYCRSQAGAVNHSM